MSALPEIPFIDGRKRIVVFFGAISLFLAALLGAPVASATAVKTVVMLALCMTIQIALSSLTALTDIAKVFAFEAAQKKSPETSTDAADGSDE